jgi:uncharacterized protein (TIGR03067 family)
MRFPALIVLIFTFTVFSSVFGEEPKEDEKLKGTWLLTGLEIDGKAISQEELKKNNIVMFGAGKITTREEGKPDDKVETQYKVDPTKKPKTIDIAPETPERGVILGIYEIEGDVLKICVGRPGKERPIKFETKSDSGHALTVLKRMKQ